MQFQELIQDYFGIYISQVFDVPKVHKLDSASQILSKVEEKIVCDSQLKLDLLSSAKEDEYTNEEAPQNRTISFEMFKGSKMIHKVIETITHRDAYFFIISGSIGNLISS